MRETGRIETGTGLRGIKFAHGILNVGEPMANPVIREVKREAFPGYVQIIDAPPGTSCPVVETISDADLVVLVTEPTPFGLHDLRIVVEVAQARAENPRESSSTGSGAISLPSPGISASKSLKSLPESPRTGRWLKAIRKADSFWRPCRSIVTTLSIS